jgi:peptidoglycan/xylan/chitin deacetylase (PgdA/CDA1 family)
VSDVLVLCYHAVSERWPADLSVTPSRFERQIELLVSRGYRGATFHQAVHSPPSRRTLAVTFDDSYRSVIRLALPILSRLGIPGTVFVPTGYAGREDPMSWPGIEQWVGGEHEDELLPMSWEELDSLSARGWEVGSHTRTHPHLTRLDDAALSDELRRSREDCETSLGRPCRSLAYPYGDTDRRVVEATREAGYSAAAALPSPLHPEAALDWPRIGVYHRDDEARFRRKVSPAIRRLRSTRAWRVAHPIASRLRP